MMQRHVISVLVENQYGVLARVAGLFSARGFNIDSLTVGPTEDETVSRMTIVVVADDPILEQVVKQLRKLVTTIKVVDFVGKEHVSREMVFVRVQAEPGKRFEVMQIVETFRAQIVDISPKDMIIEFTGDEYKIQALIEVLRPYGIKDLARSGKVALARGMEYTR